MQRATSASLCLVQAHSSQHHPLGKRRRCGRETRLSLQGLLRRPCSCLPGPTTRSSADSSPCCTTAHSGRSVACTTGREQRRYLMDGCCSNETDHIRVFSYFTTLHLIRATSLGDFPSGAKAQTKKHLKSNFHRGPKAWQEATI